MLKSTFTKMLWIKRKARQYMAFYFEEGISRRQALECALEEWDFRNA